MENVMPSWLSFYSSNLLLSLQGVQQPCEDPSVDSSFNYRTQRVLFSCACLHTNSNALLAEYLLPEHSTVLSSCAPCTCSMPTWQSFTESSVILILLSELTTEFSLCAPLAPAQCPLGRASQNSSELLSTTVSLLHSLASKVFSNLEVFPELLIPVLVPQHVFV
jgi:hypothetical protein